MKEQGDGGCSLGGPETPAQSSCVAKGVTHVHMQTVVLK